MLLEYITLRLVLSATVLIIFASRVEWSRIKLWLRSIIKWRRGRLYKHTVRKSALRLCFVSGAQRAADSARAASGDLAGLGARRPVPPHCSGLSHVLLVTTTVRVIHGVHRHTTHDGPLVSLSLITTASCMSKQQAKIKRD